MTVFHVIRHINMYTQAYSQEAQKSKEIDLSNTCTSIYKHISVELEPNIPTTPSPSRLCSVKENYRRSAFWVVLLKISKFIKSLTRTKTTPPTTIPAKQRRALLLLPQHLTKLYITTQYTKMRPTKIKAATHVCKRHSHFHHLYLNRQHVNVSHVQSIQTPWL